MAQQIKKKFIGADQIDGSKIKLLQGQSVRGVNSLGQEVDLVKISSNDKVEVLGQEVALKSELTQEISDRQSGDASTLASAQSYADQKIADLVNSAPEVLDTLKELSDALGGDANFATTVAGQIGAVDSKVNGEISRAQAAELALDQKIDGNFEIYETDIELVRSDISANSNAISQEITNRQAADASLQSQIDSLGNTFATDAELSSAVSSLESQIDDLDGYAQDIRSDLDDLDGYAQDIRSDLDQEILDRDSADTAKLAEAKAYTDSQIAAIPAVDLSGYYTKSEIDPQISTLDSRIDALEEKGFSKGSVVVGSELSFVDLDRQYSILFSVSVGRLMVHEGEDFTVSVVEGKTRLTWIGSLVNPGGEEAIETGDKVFFSGAF